MESMRMSLEKLRAQLELDRASFLSHWRELGENILPRRPRFTLTEGNRGDRRNQKIIDSTAVFAARTLASGMTSGITSPARPWFKLTTQDPDLAESGGVKAWLHQVQTRMNTVFSRSNLYEILPASYADMGVFGTAVVFAEEDFDSVVRFYSIPLGTHYLADDHRGKLGIFMREFRMTVRQLVEKFGEENLSQMSKGALAAGMGETWVDVCHVVQGNKDADQSKLGGRYKKYSSIYYERAVNGKNLPTDEKALLRESGYDYFPVFALRWERTGEDVYGTNCPGMVALGDIKGLQILQKNKAKAIEKLINPPMIAPPEMRTERLSILPGDVSYSGNTNAQAIRPAHEVNFRFEPILEDIRSHQERIRQAFYADLFLMLSQDDRAQRATATEINERREEKLLALGPVLEQLNQDLLDPLVDLVFDLMDKQGLIPTAPQELQGVPLRVEYISIMAQAQKLVSVSGIERFQQFLLAQMQADPSALDVVNTAELVSQYGDITSVPPGVIRPKEEVDAIQAEKAKAQQAKAMAEQIPAAAGAANQLANAPMDTDNALNRLLSQANAGAIAPQA
jgi:hypothetical protein